jgi:hypothetical protein
MSGVRPSDGWVHGLLDRAAAAVAAANKAIRAPIILAQVICGDETRSAPAPGPRPARNTCRSRARTCSPITSSQKISGRLRSEKTTRDRYAIRGYASTAIKHGIAVFAAIRDALAGNPWIPPIPAIT